MSPLPVPVVAVAVVVSLVASVVVEPVVGVEAVLLCPLHCRGRPGPAQVQLRQLALEARNLAMQMQLSGLNKARRQSVSMQSKTSPLRVRWVRSRYLAYLRPGSSFFICAPAPFMPPACRLRLLASTIRLWSA